MHLISDSPMFISCKINTINTTRTRFMSPNTSWTWPGRPAETRHQTQNGHGRSAKHRKPVYAPPPFTTGAGSRACAAASGRVASQQSDLSVQSDMREDVLWLVARHLVRHLLNNPLCEPSSVEYIRFLRIDPRRLFVVPHPVTTSR